MENLDEDLALQIEEIRRKFPRYCEFQTVRESDGFRYWFDDAWQVLGDSATESIAESLLHKLDLLLCRHFGVEPPIRCLNVLVRLALAGDGRGDNGVPPAFERWPSLYDALAEAIDSPEQGGAAYDDVVAFIEDLGYTKVIALLALDSYRTGRKAESAFLCHKVTQESRTEELAPSPPSFDHLKYARQKSNLSRRQKQAILQSFSREEAAKIWAQFPTLNVQLIAAAVSKKIATEHLEKRAPATVEKWIAGVKKEVFPADVDSISDVS